MSADNYAVIRKAGSKFAVLTGSFSWDYPGDGWPPLSEGSASFSTLEEALAEALDLETEGGLRFVDPGCFTKPAPLPRK